jgi:molybdopterin molybdotransferase
VSGLVKLQGFQKLTLTDEALKTWLNTLQIGKPKTIQVPLSEALGRVLTQDLVAVEDLPRFDKSAMDGYSVKAADIEGASQSKPALLKLTQENHIHTGEAKQIWTGNRIPEGADTVVMIEKTQLRPDGTVEIWNALTEGINVAKIGEDTTKGTLIAAAGTRLTPYHLGIAAAFGYTTLPVAAKPKFAILATGNEVVAAPQEREPNQIYDSNKPIVAAMCHELGADTLNLGIAKDTTTELAQKIQQGLQTADGVITTGGTSVGCLDLVPEVIDSLGKPGVVVHGMALRPAMPTGVAVIEGKPIMILSGNPVAAVVGFEVFMRPLICKMLGMPKTEPRPTLNAKLTHRIVGILGRKTYVRVHATLQNGEFLAEPISAKGAGSISTMTQSNGYLILPENREGAKEGETVQIQLFAPLEVN